MFSIYPLNKFNVSPLIDLNQFIENNESSEILGDEPFDMNDNSQQNKEINNIMKLGIDDDYLNKLSQYCSPELLKDTEEDEDKPPSCSNKNPMSHLHRMNYEPLKITPDALKLHTVSKLQERIKKDVNYLCKNSLKYAGKNNLLNEFKPPQYPPDLIPGKELLIKLRFFRPFNNDSIKNEKSILRPKFYCDIIVLGSQTLDILRDKMLCPNDFAVNNDVSEDPNADFAFAKDIYKSGCFFIEGTFYNDMRYPSNIDYSACVKKWARNRSNIGEFKTELMENTQFNQLSVHLGYPQVYQHQGNCEHIFIFQDVEILQPSHICYSSNYPYFKAFSQIRAIYCNMCGMFVSKWIVKESKRVPFDPAFFCDSCFKSYNYVDGKKVGNFKAYPYHDKTNVL